MEVTNDILADYIGHDKKREDFIKSISENTGIRNVDRWFENLNENHKNYKEHGWAAQALQGKHQGKTAVMLGASPAVTKQFDLLKNLQHDPDFVMVGITSGLENLLKNDIKPKYVMVADASPRLKRFWENIDMAQTKDITLIANICANPEIIKLWKGDVKFVALWTNIEKLDKKIQKKYQPTNGTGDMFPSLSSQYNFGTAFSYLVLECPIIIFVGNELSFPSDDSEKDTYYPDRKDHKDKWKRGTHIDIYGKTVYTIYMFLALKYALEDFLAKVSGAGIFFNCTEAGIFGVNKNGNLPWIYQLKLKSGIAQARHIMYYGTPLYKESPIVKPEYRVML